MQKLFYWKEVIKVSVTPSFIGTCTQFRSTREYIQVEYIWLWNQSIPGKPVKKGCRPWFEHTVRATSVLQPQAAGVFPQFLITLAVNGCNVSKSSDRAGVCALARLLVNKSHKGESNGGKTAISIYLLFLTRLKTWCFKRTEQRDLLIRHDSLHLVTCPFPRKGIASNAVGVPGLPVISCATNQSRAKRTGKQLEQLKEMGGGNMPTTKLIFWINKSLRGLRLVKQ